ncbi:unnamed protein product [Prunus armeniaca]
MQGSAGSYVACSEKRMSRSTARRSRALSTPVSDVPRTWGLWESCRHALLLKPRGTPAHADNLGKSHRAGISRAIMIQTQQDDTSILEKWRGPSPLQSIIR